MTTAILVVHRRCDARRGERPHEERHARTCISLVRSGSFGYRLGATTTTLGPGSIMLGNAGTPYVCSHEHAGGDHCLAVSYDADTIAEVGARAGVRDGAAPFDVPALPPLPEATAFAHALAASIRGASAWSGDEIALEQYEPSVAYGFDIINPEAGPYDYIGVQAWFDEDRMSAWSAPAAIGFVGDCG